MVVIPLASEFVPFVLDGRKVSTVRFGRRPYPTGKCVLRSGGQDVPVEIRCVRFCQFAELTETDALADGFSSLEELHRELRRFYPNVTPVDEVTIVEFMKQ
jgi:hypothetical protein